MASDDDKSKTESEKKIDDATEKAESHDETKHETSHDDAPDGAPPPVAKKKGNSSKGFILLLAAAAVVALVVTSRGRDKGPGAGAPPAPPPGWGIGQTVDVELTLVASDKRDLACAYKDVVAGKHCEFEASKTAWSKGGGNDDKIVLRPYMTTGQQPLMAAGLWSQLPPQLPPDRFNVKCKLAIDGKLSKPEVRWHSDNVFYAETQDWMAGSLQGCAISKLRLHVTSPGYAARYVPSVVLVSATRILTPSEGSTSEGVVALRCRRAASYRRAVGVSPP